jgi:anti-anti-sigma factor
MDSTALGRLVSLFKEARSRDLDFAVIASGQPERLLRAMRMHRMFPVAARADQLPAPSHPVVRRDAGCLRLVWDAEITAANAPDFHAWVLEHWGHAPDACRLELDLEACPFIDSSGLGVLLRCRRLVVQRPGASFVLTAVHANVRNVLRLARLEAVFLAPEPA